MISTTIIYNELYNYSMDDKLAILAIAIIIGIVILCPVGLIIALNTLFVGVIFPVAIPINVWTYLSMFLIEILAFGRFNYKQE